MSSSTPPEVKDDDPPAGPKMGSEYMDARTYLTQARASRVKESDETFHGSNDSDYGIVALQKR